LGGGSELFVERVARYLVQTGWDVTICTAAYEGSPRDEVCDGIRFRRRGGRLSVYLHGLAFLLTRAGRRSDVVVDVQNGIPFFSPLVRRRGIVNLLHHVHREQWHIIFKGLGGRIGWWLESRVAPRVYRRHPYVSVSEATRQELTALGIAAHRVSIVHNGLDDPHPHARAERASVPTICVLGRLVPHKQIEHALDAAAAARSSLPDLHVDVVGEGWWHEQLVEHAERLGICDAVTFHGRVPDRERDALLDRAWLMLTPSVKEGWGIAIMEAAAHGVPSIAYSTAGGVCESIADGETGFLVDDAPGLVKRTEELLTDATLRNWMSDNAREHAARFDWTSTGRRFAEILADLR
jgi:glycosyltransferase involved in cell wall biosynthesis